MVRLDKRGLIWHLSAPRLSAGCKSGGFRRFVPSKVSVERAWCGCLVCCRCRFPVAVPGGAWRCLVLARRCRFPLSRWAFRWGLNNPPPQAAVLVATTHSYSPSTLPLPPHSPHLNLHQLSSTVQQARSPQHSLTLKILPSVYSASSFTPLLVEEDRKYTHSLKSVNQHHSFANTAYRITPTGRLYCR
jgi:hypothetical protein